MAASGFVVPATPAAIVCCLCGVSIQPSATNMCVDCLRNQVDITEGIQKHVNITYCKMCARYLQPPRHWMPAEPESKELLTFCLKRIRGLQKVKLVDAGFIWTEPHSKRLKVKLTVQAEVMNGAILQQTFVVEFQVEWNMCLDCNRANTNVNAWKAVVQVRQHVDHKRTFMFLEQLILKHNAHEQCINIKEIHQGIDFFFANRAHGQKFVDFLQGVVPARFRHDKQLVSHDTHSMEYNYKYTFSVEIAPICNGDLICLPPKLAQQHGNIGPLILCTKGCIATCRAAHRSLWKPDPRVLKRICTSRAIGKVTNVLALTCIHQLRTVHIDAKQFFTAPFAVMANSRQLTRYVVLDCEPTGERDQRFQLADVQVARQSDFGVNNVAFAGRTHLGPFLQAGDMALGYDLARFVSTDDALEKYVQLGYQVPDFVLVKKDFSEARARRRAQRRVRPWKVRRLQVEGADDNAHGRKTKASGLSAADEVEQFLQELEEDKEMRKHVDVYRDPASLIAAADAANAMDTGDGEDSAADIDIPLEELLEDLEALDVEP